MKKILSLAIALTVFAQVNANEIGPKSPVGMSVVKHGSLVKLFYRGEQTGKVKVKILNERRNIVFMETMQNTENFMRPYNFAALPEGDYTIQITDEQGQRFQTVSHRRADKKRVAHLTRLNGEERKYMLAVPNDGRDALTVRIYDETQRLVYQDTQIVDGDFAKVYNLNTIAGAHTFEISDRAGNVNRLTKNR